MKTFKTFSLRADQDLAIAIENHCWENKYGSVNAFLTHVVESYLGLPPSAKPKLGRPPVFVQPTLEEVDSDSPDGFKK